MSTSLAEVQKIAQPRIRIDFHQAYKQIFFGSNTRKKVVAKRRRFGWTKGVANYAILKMLKYGVSPVLWVDTVHPNIDRYVERYFMPVLRPLGSDLWQWRQQKKELRIYNSVCDFRSADKPENMEGFGYKLIILNEAGIILKNPYLWYNAILPMSLDYNAEILIGGTPKGRKAKKEKGDSLFYQLWQKGDPDSPTFDPNWESFHYTSYDNVKPYGYLEEREIDELIAETPPSIVDQEIYAHFVDLQSGDIFKREWFRYYKELPQNSKDCVFI